MSMEQMKGTMPRSAKRRRRKRRCAIRLLTPIVLMIALIVLGLYYVEKYHEHMEYVRYPLRHEELLITWSEEFELEPWHVAAVVCCESGFWEQSVSKVGARGLMQIMPETGEWLAGKFGEESQYRVDVLFDPETNLKYGCWYLGWLMRRYEGDRILVTIAYHAGHGKVDSWLKKPEISPDGKTIPVENIPYDATRSYVRRVLRACEKYQKLYDFDGAGETA